MAINKETPTWYDGIYLIEESDSPLGGLGGTTNIQFVQLACRTRYLFELLRNLYAASTSGRSIASWHVTKTIPAETIVKLPIEYVVGARSLMLFSDITGEIGPKYFSELGVFDQMSDSVKFTFEIPAGAVLTAVSLATSVDKVVYDGKYKYEFAWTELYHLYGMVTTDNCPSHIDFNTSSKYEADIKDDLGIARVVDHEDYYDADISGKFGTFALTADFYDYEEPNEELILNITQNGIKASAYDITLKDAVAFEATSNLNLTSKIAISDTLSDIDEDLYLDVWRNGVIEKVVEFTDEHEIAASDALRVIENRNLAYSDEYSDEMDSLRVKGSVVTNFADYSTGALERSLVLSINTYSSGDTIFLTDMYAGADDSDLVVIASKK